jgi:hypothetical protein
MEEEERRGEEGRGERREEKETSKTRTHRPCFPNVTNFNTIYLQDVTSSSQ